MANPLGASIPEGPLGTPKSCWPCLHAWASRCGARRRHMRAAEQQPSTDCSDCFSEQEKHPNAKGLSARRDPLLSCFSQTSDALGGRGNTA